MIVFIWIYVGGIVDWNWKGDIKYIYLDSFWILYNVILVLMNKYRYVIFKMMLNIFEGFIVNN